LLPRSKVSMMIIVPPQHGHGGRQSRRAAASASVSPVPLHSASGWGAASSSRARVMLALRPALASSPQCRDAVEALGQDVEQEAADELARIERHGPVALVPVATVVLVSERHAGLVERDQPAVGDGDAVGVARQVRQHGLGSCEGRLGIDEPVLLSERHQEGREGALVAEAGMIGEELQAVGNMGLGELVEKETAGTALRARARAGKSRSGRTPTARR
jgi:hypothetical protein